MALRQSEVSDLILYELYWMTADPDAPDEIPPSDLSDMLELTGKYSFSGRFYDLALDDVSSRALIERTGVLPDQMGISDVGVRYVEGQLDISDSFIYSVHQNRDSEKQSSIPASDRFVELVD